MSAFLYKTLNRSTLLTNVAGIIASHVGKMQDIDLLQALQQQVILASSSIHLDIWS